MAYGKQGWIRKNNYWGYSINNRNVVSSWKLINGKWYHFDQNGNMNVGWFFDELSTRAWYYFVSDGSMRTGWMKSGSKWFYMDKNGKMAEGWRNVGGDWYYFEARLGGAMRTNAWIDGYDYTKISFKKIFDDGLRLPHYYVDSSGKWIKSKTYNGQEGTWKGSIFVEKDGLVSNGPTFVNGKLYLFGQTNKIGGYVVVGDTGYVAKIDNNGAVTYVEQQKFGSDNRMKMQNGDIIEKDVNTGTLKVIVSGSK